VEDRLFGLSFFFDDGILVCKLDGSCGKDQRSKPPIHVQQETVKAMNVSRYIVELLTPRQSEEDFESKLEIFKKRYIRILGRGAMASVPDNPLGNLHFTAMEVLGFLELPVDPEKTLLHLNTFHRKKDVETFLGEARDRGLKRLLVVSGDGGPRLSKLEPEDIGADSKSVTSIEMLEFIGREYPGVFTCGVAFNQYEPREDEARKLERKIEAGARFIITQPLIGRDETLRFLGGKGLPVWIGAWMSRRVDLLCQCIDRSFDPVMNWDAEENLNLLRGCFPDCGLYLAQLNFNREWPRIVLEECRGGSAAPPS
jgi:methylenetetrahydrofolate reductase (NADPH)